MSFPDYIQTEYKCDRGQNNVLKRKPSLTDQSQLIDSNVWCFFFSFRISFFKM